MAQKRNKGVSDAEAAERQRLNIRLTPEDYRRLGVHALYMGVTPGALVGKLIRDHLREFRVQANPASSIDRLGSVAESSQLSPAPVAQG